MSTTLEAQTFLWSWRGFLVGTRRSWHAHQRVHLEGYRENYLVGKHSTQLYQLRRAAGLLVHLFGRGGLAWGFNLTTSHEFLSWGTVYSGWRPGILTNSFGFRLRRVHSARRLRRTLNQRRVSPTRRARLARRWGRLRGSRRLGWSVCASRVQRKMIRQTGLSKEVTLLGGGGIQRGASCWSFRRQPREGYIRAGWLRPWWSVTTRTYVTGKTQPPRPGVRGLGSTRLLARFSRTVNKVHRRSRAPWRTPRVTPSGVTRGFRSSPGWTACSDPSRRSIRPVRRSGQHQRRFFFVPAVVLNGPLSLVECSILGEASVAGTPVVTFGGADLVPRVSLFPVLWNTTTVVDGGILGWLENLHGRSVRVGLFRTLWSRLGHPRS